MSAFPARYPGRCAECSERIEEGDPIRMTDVGAIHNDCSDHQPPIRREHPACPVCWLTHPKGACDRD